MKIEIERVRVGWVVRLDGEIVGAARTLRQVRSVVNEVLKGLADAPKTEEVKE